jgi:uncharacterized membrane protein YhiD involved in acid resistance
LISALDTTVSLIAAFILGGLIGLERQYRQRSAGLRTNVLVAVGAAILVHIANSLGALEKNLTDSRLNYRKFQSTVSIGPSKWSSR